MEFRERLMEATKREEKRVLILAVFWLSLLILKIVYQSFYVPNRDWIWSRF